MLRAGASAPREHTEQGKERKQQLVDAAMELFAERGYAATRIADICDAAGVAKGLFYWYFPTKHDLFAELVRSMRQRLRRAQAAALDPPPTRSPTSARASRRACCSWRSTPSYFALLQVERTDPHLAATLREGSDVYLRDVLAHIREAQRDGQIADTDPTLLALGVLGAVSSFSNAWRNGRIELSADELASFVGDWVVHAWESQPRLVKLRRPEAAETRRGGVCSAQFAFELGVAGEQHGDEGVDEVGLELGAAPGHDEPGGLDPSATPACRRAGCTARRTRRRR